MKEILKKIIIATITLFTALLITVLVTGNNLFEENLLEIFIYYLAYMIVYIIQVSQVANLPILVHKS